ncbi:hypothetical protein JCM5296_000356, partial [Sporobolomyces johnsonii]
ATPPPPRSTPAHLRLTLRNLKCRVPPTPPPLPPYYSAHTPLVRPSPLFRAPSPEYLPPPAQNAPIASTSHAILPSSPPSSPRGLLSDAEERWHSLAPDPCHCPQLADDELNSDRDDYLPHTHPRTHIVNDIPTDVSERDLDPWTTTRVKIVAMDPDVPDALPNAYSLTAMHRADAEKAKRRRKRKAGKGKRKEYETDKELLEKIDRWLDPDEPFSREQGDGSSEDDEPSVGFRALAMSTIVTERARRLRRRAEGGSEEDDDDVGGG